MAGSLQFYRQIVWIICYHAITGRLGAPGGSGDDLGYWCPQYLLNTNDKSALSYSVPLISGSGNAYGVLGVEISQDYLKKFLSPGELGSGTAYSMAIVGRAGGKTAYSLTIPYGSSEMEKVLGGYSSFTAGKAVRWLLPGAREHFCAKSRIQGADAAKKEPAGQRL